MLNTIIKIAESIKNKYLFEIDSKVDANEFYKEKLSTDKSRQKIISDNIYKKVK